METAFNEEVPNSLMTRRVFGEMTLTPSSLSTIGQYGKVSIKKSKILFSVPNTCTLFLLKKFFNI